MPSAGILILSYKQQTNHIMKKYLFIIFLGGAIILTSCSHHVENDALTTTEEESTLLSELNQFNESLALQTSSPRTYDYIMGHSIENTLTRASANQNSIWSQDVEGAKVGGKWGARIGKYFDGLTGAIAGALWGGMLVGAFYSCAEAYRQNNASIGVSESLINSALDSLVSADSRFKPAHIYSTCIALPDSYYASVDAVAGANEMAISLNSSAMAVGRAHNVIVEEMMSYLSSSSDSAEEDSLSNESGMVVCSGDLEGDVTVGAETTEQVKIILGKETCYEIANSFSAQSEYYQMIENCLEESEGESQDSSILSQIVNLFCEAATMCLNDDDDLSSVVNYYDNMASSSIELSDVEKQIVSSCLAVAVYSISYWY